jgi:hypothetical protein
MAVGFELRRGTSDADLAVPQAIPFHTGFSAGLGIDLIGFTGWVLEPLFTHREKGSSYAVLSSICIGY